MLTDTMQRDFYSEVVCNRRSPHRYFAIRLGPALIGMGGLTNIAWEAGSAEISLILSAEQRGKGLGRQSVVLLLEEAFCVLRLVHVYGEVYQSNPGALGFWSRLARDWDAKTAILPARSFWAGRHWDSLYFDFDHCPAIQQGAA